MNFKISYLHTGYLEICFEEMCVCDRVYSKYIFVLCGQALANHQKSSHGSSENDAEATTQGKTGDNMNGAAPDTLNEQQVK